MPTGEIQTDAIVRHALMNGKKVFVPYIHTSGALSPEAPKSVMDMVNLRSLAEYESLKRDNWGIPTISPNTMEGRARILNDSTEDSLSLDLILVPGVAFDTDARTGLVRRLGHGKGFYDYFLHRYNESRADRSTQSLSPGPGVLLYGLALAEQVLDAKTGESVPVGEQDHLLHGLLVGDGIIVR